MNQVIPLEVFGGVVILRDKILGIFLLKENKTMG